MAEKPGSKNGGKRSIEIGFMFRLAAKVGLLLAVGALIPAAVFWRFTSDMVGDSYGEIIGAIGTLRLALLKVTVLSAAGQIVLMGMLVAFVALLASHKITGPLVRFDQCIRNLADGNLRQRVGFRRGDQDKSLPEAFHALCDRLRGRVESARDSADDLCALRDELKQRTPDGVLNEDETTDIANRIRKQAGALAAAASFEANTSEE